MNKPDIVKVNNKEINIIKVGVNNQLTKKQKALLLLMSECIKDNVVFDWDVMVQFYYNNVNKHHYTQHWNKASGSWQYSERDIKKIYIEYNSTWIYTVRPKIRTWFITNMGSMILKGSILALPIIELQ